MPLRERTRPQCVITRAHVYERAWLIIDLAEATDPSAELMELLLDLDRAVRARGWRLAIVRPADNAVWGVIKGAARDRTIAVFDRRTDAVDWANAESGD